MPNLTEVKDPQLDGIKLEETESDDIVTKRGIKVVNFIGDDGNEYERAEWPNGIIQWFRV